MRNVIFTLSFTLLAALLQAQNFEKETKLVPEDGTASNSLGWSVSIDGDYALAAAYYDDDNGMGSGSVYVYHNENGIWRQQTKLLASDGEAYDTFGWSVCIDGDYAVIGCRGDKGTNENLGAVYIFKNISDTWSLQTKLYGNEEIGYKYFGKSVSLDNGLLVVGGENSSGRGSISIFKNNSDTWERLNTYGSPYSTESFGSSVSVSGNFIIVGDSDTDYKTVNTGAAWLFKYTLGSNRFDYIEVTANDGQEGDAFGISVSIDGDYAIIGAISDDDNGSGSGSAYIFYNNNGVWEQHSKIKPMDGANKDLFGGSVGISGDYAIVSAYYDDDNGDNSGSAYIFNRSNNEWKQYFKLTPSDGEYMDQFGFSVSINGGNAFIGAIGADDNGNNSGSAYMFSNDMSTSKKAIKEEKGIKIYPNPTNGLVSIEYDKPEVKHFEILDIKGEVIIKHNSPKSWQNVNLNNFSEGIYILKSYLEDSIICKKIILKK